MELTCYLKNVYDSFWSHEIKQNKIEQKLQSIVKNFIRDSTRIFLMYINLIDIASYVNHNKPHCTSRNFKEIIDNSEKPFET